MNNCQNVVCANCRPLSKPGKIYCVLCELGLADDEEIDVNELEKSKIKRAQHTVSLKPDEAGQMDGWDKFMELIGDDAGTKDGPNLVNPDDIGKAYDNAIKRLKPGDYTLLKVSDGIFSLQKRDGTQYEVILSDGGDSGVEFKGLPEEFEKPMSVFSAQEKREKPWLCLHSVLRDAERIGRPTSRPDDVTNNKSSPLIGEPSHSEGWQLKQENPSSSYDIVKRIAVGGFARVFEVKRKSDNKICALKYVEVSSQKERENVLNEVGIMMKCKTDTVVECYETFEYKKRLWIFLEMLNGGAITPFLEEQAHKLSENICKYIAYRVMLGLKFLHDQGIMHRDIKSDNILVTMDGEVKLADFGYAIQLKTKDEARNSKVGTICWMAPEMILGQNSYNNKVDVWSFGIFLVELAVGEPPYINEKQVRVLFNIANNPAPTIEKGHWSDEFCDFVDCCLKKDPEERHTID